jgi:hypothetical protein
VERPLAKGYAVRTLDDVFSGFVDRLRDADGGFDVLEESIMDTEVVSRAAQGVHSNAERILVYGPLASFATGRAHIVERRKSQGTRPVG